VNGKAGSLSDLTEGSHTIAVRDLPPDAWTDPTLAGPATEKGLQPKARASSSHEAHGWGLANLFAPEDEAVRKGYSSKAHKTDRATEWLEFDLGAETALAKVILLRSGGTTVNGGLGVGFPRDFTVRVATKPGAFETVASCTDCPVPDEEGLTVDLYTVIGYPNARYVRLVATRLGEPGVGEPGAFRLQLSRLRLLRP
jgi:hypothetical protein